MCAGLAGVHVFFFICVGGMKVLVRFLELYVVRAIAAAVANAADCVIDLAGII